MWKMTTMQRVWWGVRKILWDLEVTWWGWQDSRRLRSPSAGMRLRAAKAIGERGLRNARSDALTVNALRSLVRDGRSEVRQAARESLGVMRDYWAKALTRDAPDLSGQRQAAAKVLAAVEDRRAIETLIGALGHNEYSVREAAREGLCALGQSAVNPLERALAGGNECARKEAARALGELGDSRGIGALAAAVRDERWGVRETVIRALAKIEDQRALGLLVTALEDEDSEVRSAAIGAVVERGGQAGELLASTLNAGGARARSAAAEALGEIGDARAFEALAAALQDECLDVRRTVVDALGKFTDPRALHPLITALEDEDSRVRAAGAEALAGLRGIALTSLLSVLTAGKTGAASAAADALGKIGDPRAVQPLADALGRKDSDVRAAAAAALGAIGDHRGLGPLLTALSDEHPGVRAAGARALGQLAHPEGLRRLAAGLKDESRLVRRATAWALTPMRYKGGANPSEGLPGKRNIMDILPQLEETGLLNPEKHTCVSYTFRRLRWDPERNVCIQAATQQYCVYCEHFADPEFTDPAYPEGGGHCSFWNAGIGCRDSCICWGPSEDMPLWLSERGIRDYGLTHSWYRLFDEESGSAEVGADAAAERVMDERREAEVAAEGGPVAEKLRDMAKTARQLWGEGQQFESAFARLFADLEEESADVRAEASRKLAESQRAVQEIISIYQQNRESDPRKSILAGRVLGRKIDAGKQEMIHAQTSSIMFGINVAFTPCVCGHCGKLNVGIPVPESGLYKPFYGQKDDESCAYALPVLCDHCGKEFFIAWDSRPT